VTIGVPSEISTEFPCGSRIVQKTSKISLTKVLRRKDPIWKEVVQPLQRFLFIRFSDFKEKKKWTQSIWNVVKSATSKEDEKDIEAKMKELEARNSWGKERKVLKVSPQDPAGWF
jgi:hypothetical protein